MSWDIADCDLLADQTVEHSCPPTVTGTLDTITGACCSESSASVATPDVLSDTVLTTIDISADHLYHTPEKPPKTKPNSLLLSALAGARKRPRES